jgi:hypothetical protein
VHNDSQYAIFVGAAGADAGNCGRLAVTNIGAATQALFPEQVWRNGSTVMVFALPEGPKVAGSK